MHQMLWVLMLFYQPICQHLQPQIIINTITKIMIQSTIPLLYDVIYQKRAIIKRIYKSFKFDFTTSKCICEFDDYAVLENGALQNINTVVFPIPFAEVQSLFEMLQNPILTTEKFAVEIEKLVTIAGLYKCKTSLNDDLTTDYGGQPENWEI